MTDLNPTPNHPVAHFEIQHRQFLNPEGQTVAQLPDFAQDPAFLIRLYQAMVRTRVFDTKAIALQRTGKMGTYPSTLGQEAIGVGIGAAMAPEDVLCPYYRDQAAQFWRGVTMQEILLYWGGDERGSDFQAPEVKQDFPICVPIASQTLHAVGVATAMKLRKQPRVTVTTVGDGGTSRGDFYEAMNLAGIWKLPIVFVVNNNQWAISVPRSHQTAAKTLAQKGIAAGIACVQVDGNDVIAVYDAVKTAVSRARANEGPTVVEALTYRLCDHTTADDAKRYRLESELEKHRAFDPILRLSRFLINQKAWDNTKEEGLQKAALEEVLKAVEVYSKIAPLGVEAMFDYLYATLPDSLLAEKQEALQLPKVSLHG